MALDSLPPFDAYVINEWPLRGICRVGRNIVKLRVHEACGVYYVSAGAVHMTWLLKVDARQRLRNVSNYTASVLTATTQVRSVSNRPDWLPFGLGAEPM